MPTASEPVPDLATSYGVDRSDRALRLTPLAHVGPGRTARFAFTLGLILGLACVGGAICLGFSMQEKMGNGGNAPPPWVPWIFPGGIFLFPLGFLTLAGCLKLYVTFHRPLLAEPNGALTYGHQSLVGIGEAQGVRLERCTQCIQSEDGPDTERKYAHLYIERADGRFVELPTPYFSNLEGWELAETLSAALAATLKVPLSFEPPPGDQSTPQRHARRWSRVFGSVALLIGIMHFLAGFGLLAASAAALVDPAIRADLPPPWFSAIFLCSGTAACYFGCRPFGGRRTLVRLLATLALLEGAALLAVWLLN